LIRTRQPIIIFTERKVRVKRLIIGLLFPFFMTSMAAAQTGSGYVFIAPGQFHASGESSFGIHFGGGGKVFFSTSGLGLGAELGIAAPKDHFTDRYAGLFSGNGYYIFKTGNRRIQPFVTAGYSRTFGHQSGMNWINFGGGLMYWFKHGGYLLEFRDHMRRENSITGQFWTIRFGFVFG
jgi:hypothetical protein